MMKCISILSASVAMLASVPALADPVLSSSANVGSVHLSVADALAADVTLAPVGGTAAPDYNESASLASIDQSFHLFGTVLSVDAGVHTGIISTLAQSGYPDSAMGSANIANAQTGLTTSLLGAIPLAALGVSANAINSTSVAGIDGAGLFATGSSSIENLIIGGSILDALGLNLGVFSNPAPNTVALSLLGLNITLNEQLMNETADSIMMTTNAVHISLDDYLFAGSLLSGDIILGHSQASVTGYEPVAAPVPEPASWALMIGGFALVGLCQRRRPRLAFA